MNALIIQCMAALLCILTPCLIDNLRKKHGYSWADYERMMSRRKRRLRFIRRMFLMLMCISTVLLTLEQKNNIGLAINCCVLIALADDSMYKKIIRYIQQYKGQITLYGLFVVSLFSGDLMGPRVICALLFTLCYIYPRKKQESVDVP